MITGLIGGVMVGQFVGNLHSRLLNCPEYGGKSSLQISKGAKKKPPSNMTGKIRILHSVE